ncbi:MAG: N-6 DNA methylase, partial [Thermomicrobiales bacterium]
MSDLLENYLRELRDIRRSGAATPETSYYPALSNLLNGVGQPLRPPVRAVLQLANKGAGLPDGGLFTADQLRGSDDAAPLQGQVPARGVIEAKPTSDDIDAVADSEQVARYLARYGLVLVTNYRDFVVVDRDPEGRARLGERYRLAADERTFWAAASDPRSAAERHGARFFEYLSRVLRRNAPLAAPKDVAFFLASYARDANARIAQSGLAGLAPIRDALQQTLGIQFQGATGQDFFRSTLVQTLFYGIFSAWVLWSKALPLTSAARFDWRTSQWTLRVPVIRAIFEHISRPSHLEPLELVEVLDWTGDALNRVDRPAFFGQFSQDQAVQYFYEPFLEAFDPDLRRTLGVWYTPPEVVAYMVERVDTVLRQELGIADGLADPRVHVLDPCTGTGSFLVAVLRRIARTLRERGDDALLGEDLKRAAIDRVHGFELLPAPFVVAHLQIGLLLQDLGAPFSDRTNERASVYLTNSLTGWDTAAETAQLPMFPELGAERDLARQVKHADPILVVIG